MSRFKRTFLLLTLFAMPMAAQADKIDDFIREQMRLRQIPGLSLAIIQDGKIVKAKGYGVIEKGGKKAVAPSTLFQAGSISKPVASLGALHLVEKGQLSLDEDVNTKLTTWKVPENDFTKEKKVTLRGLVSHTAGLTVHGFPGYDVQETAPNLVQIFNGEKPANTPAIRVDVKPGSLWRYSGGGYTIMQQIVIDVVRKPYPQYMQEAVLTPLGMTGSTYEQPLPAEKAKATATGHYGDRNLVRGRWHVYPEMAAAGLWTTPSDLARFAIGLQQSLASKSNPVISAEMTRQMLTDQKNSFGLGLSLAGKGPTLRFSHGGRDEGFDAFLEAYAERGQGAVIMINANDNSGAVNRIMRFIGEQYDWPEYPRLKTPNVPTVQVDTKTLESYAGRYEFVNNQMLTFAVDKGQLTTLADDLPSDPLLPLGNDKFLIPEPGAEITFLKNNAGQVTGFHLKLQGQGRIVPRVGPLIHALKKLADPDMARTRKVTEVLKAFAEGKPTEVASQLTPGAKNDFPARPYPDLAGFRSLEYIAEEEIGDRQIERHGAKVNRILYYKLLSDKSTRAILIHLTADGLITDFDVVKD